MHCQNIYQSRKYINPVGYLAPYRKPYWIFLPSRCDRRNMNKQNASCFGDLSFVAKLHIIGT